MAAAGPLYVLRTTATRQKSADQRTERRRRTNLTVEINVADVIQDAGCTMQQHRAERKPHQLLCKDNEG